LIGAKVSVIWSGYKQEIPTNRKQNNLKKRKKHKKKKKISGFYDGVGGYPCISLRFFSILPA
jgi:hypothetical protein